jgi:hypothetical protein
MDEVPLPKENIDIVLYLIVGVIVGFILWFFMRKKRKNNDQTGDDDYRIMFPGNLQYKYTDIVVDTTTCKFPIKGNILLEMDQYGRPTFCCKDNYTVIKNKNDTFYYLYDTTNKNSLLIKSSLNSDTNTNIVTIEKTVYDFVPSKTVSTVTDPNNSANVYSLQFPGGNLQLNDKDLVDKNNFLVYTLTPNSLSPNEQIPAPFDDNNQLEVFDQVNNNIITLSIVYKDDIVENVEIINVKSSN